MSAIDLWSVAIPLKILGNKNDKPSNVADDDYDVMWKWATSTNI